MKNMTKKLAVTMMMSLSVMAHANQGTVAMKDIIASLPPAIRQASYIEQDPDTTILYLNGHLASGKNCQFRLVVYSESAPIDAGAAGFTIGTEPGLWGQLNNQGEQTLTQFNGKATDLFAASLNENGIQYRNDQASLSFSPTMSGNAIDVKVVADGKQISCLSAKASAQ